MVIEMKKVKIKNRLMIVLSVIVLCISVSGCDLLPPPNSSDVKSKNDYQFLVSSGEQDNTPGRQAVTYTPKNYGEVKAVWISYIELKTLLLGKTEAEFTESIEKAFQNAKNLGLNTVVVHVRPYGDAVYQSEYFPWSAYAKGFGENPGYDPLQVMVTKAHQLDLSIHAWVNPYRSITEEESKIISNEYPFSKWLHNEKKGTNIVNLSGRWFYNPGVEEVRKLIVAGVEEIVKYYPVDAIHFDDYFYPTTDTEFDKTLYQAYIDEGGKLELDAWRRENVNTLLRDTYTAIKKINDGVLFGISPQANISNNFKNQYADVIRWCSTPGYLDYICPQIYYNFKSETTDFVKSLTAWEALATHPAIKLYIGIAPYKIGRVDQWACTGASGGACTAPNDCGAKGWMVNDPGNSSILKQQYEKIKKSERCSGFFLYNYQSLFSPEDDVKIQVESEMKNLKSALNESSAKG